MTSALRQMTIIKEFRHVTLAFMNHCGKCYVTPNLVFGPQVYTEKKMLES